MEFQRSSGGSGYDKLCKLRLPEFLPQREITQATITFGFFRCHCTIGSSIGHEGDLLEYVQHDQPPLKEIFFLHSFMISNSSKGKSSSWSVSEIT